MWELQKAASFPQLKQEHQHTPAALEVALGDEVAK